MSLKKKKILLAVTGSIAAYKALFLTRLLIKSGCEVKVLMTKAATEFVSPLSFSTLSKNEVLTNVISGDDWNNHVALGLWADVMIVAPCTATSLSKMAIGLADSIVTAVYLSAKCPVLVAPAMDLDMWKHPSTKKNIEQLKSYGNYIVPVGDGELASGLSGEGRLAEPEEILDYLTQFFERGEDLKGKKILITAGPTYEAIDPVRFIGNHSSGKMGAALANECAERGAQVTLVLGPSQIQLDHPNIVVNHVTNAASMYEAAKQVYKEVDIAVFAAAVADYTPKVSSDVKIKKKSSTLNLELVKTMDIAASLGKVKGKNQFNIGFALETNDEETHALAKLKKKNFDFIVLNSLRDKGAGFKLDTNKISILDTTGERKTFSLKSKAEVASDIINYLVKNKL